MSATKRVERVVRFTDDGRSCYEVALTYNLADPFAVTATFPDGVCSPWRFARQLLIDALGDAPVGLGDVSCWANGQFFYMRLSSPEGRATLHARRDSIHRFVELALAVVPAGEECQDFDADLDLLLMAGGL